MIVTLEDYRPLPRVDGKAWTQARLEGSADNVTFASIETYTLSTDPDPANPIARSFTSEDASSGQVWFRIVFIDEDADEQATDAIRFPTGFATRRDVTLRLGRALTDAEAAQAEAVIEIVTGLIADALGKDEVWSTALDPVPATLRSLCVEKAASAIINPGQAMDVSETLGAYAHSERYARDLEGIGLSLTDSERSSVRRVVFGTGVVSPRTPPVVDSPPDPYGQFSSGDGLWPEDIDESFLGS